ncbi:hypothetical protein CROQUDRAFT_89096 [Cronartium quercuum f. sp. fusiforme G11]|uniref:Uncharacterized protein n=1 Tax=Cronartium quercuum f. sp. fusiforme G11 TaxID=708437 RepID=A0A9P6NSH1_9BASI|nr:hypothetical protein CROQUDRAFT_89096 [Cronartium quercuum f. sp. fusiforme G11]
MSDVLNLIVQNELTLIGRTLLYFLSTISAFTRSSAYFTYYLDLDLDSRFRCRSQFILVIQTADKAVKRAAKADGRKTTLPNSLANLLEATWQALRIPSSDFPTHVPEHFFEKCVTGVRVRKKLTAYPKPPPASRSAYSRVNWSSLLISSDLPTPPSSLSKGRLASIPGYFAAILNRSSQLCLSGRHSMAA